MTDFHFYASSISTWATTTDKRTLPDLIKLFEKEGRTYSLYLVPLPHDAHYQIREYAPDVEGVKLVGCFRKH